jgi:hypothetical protein
VGLVILWLVHAYIQRTAFQVHAVEMASSPLKANAAKLILYTNWRLYPLSREHSCCIHLLEILLL